MDAIRVLPAQQSVIDQLPKDSVRRLDKCAANILRLNAKGNELIFAIGSELKIAHDALATYGHGTFGKWCEEVCKISRQSAWNYMSVVDALGGVVCKTVLQTTTAKALYFLARDSTPQDAIDEAVKAAEQGERITLAKAKQIVKEVTERTIDVEPQSVEVADDDDCDEEPSPFNLESFGIAERKARDAFCKAFSGWPEEWWPDINAVLQQLKEGDKSQW